jgi:hypothetical protein
MPKRVARFSKYLASFEMYDLSALPDRGMKSFDSTEIAMLDFDRVAIGDGRIDRSTYLSTVPANSDRLILIEGKMNKLVLNHIVK